MTHTMTTQKTAILTMGLPGAGKSTVVNTCYNVSEFTVIDCDKIKEEKSDFDPKNPGVYHEWSKKEANLRKAVAINKGENLILDTTGTNVERMFKEVRTLQAAGYSVTILYVRVKLQTAIERNANRARVVPESIIREKFETISEAFEIMSSVADKVTVINND